MPIRAVLEVAPKRSFASAIDWPGWSRSGRTEADALEALVAVAPRYAPIARAAGLRFAAPRSVAELDVVERLPGGATTEFGAPGEPASAESDTIDEGQLRRLVALLRASWSAFDAAIAAADGRQLRSGPRGGGRQVPKIVDHVLEAERGYLSKLGSRAPAERGLVAMHDAVVGALTARANGEEPPNAARTKVPWRPRYAVRRIAWHAIDHAWEIEDRLE